MLSRTRFAVLAAALLVLNTVGLVFIYLAATRTDRPKLRVLAALPTRNIDDADRLTLVFDEPLVHAGMVGRPADRSPFVVDPPPDGQWVWAQPDRLEYRLDKPLAPGRVYVVKPAADAETQTGRVLVGTSSFEFATRPLQLVSHELLSVDRSDLTLELTFNQPVNPGDLLRHLRIRTATDEDRPTPSEPASGNVLEAVSLTPEPAERILVQCPRNDAARIRLTLAAALTGHGGNRPLGRDETRYLDVTPRFALLRADVDRPSLNQDVTVELYLSSPLHGEKALPTVQTDPPVTGLRTRRGFWGSLRIEGPFQSGQTYTATVGAEAVAVDGSTLGEPQSVAFEVPDRWPGLRFPVRRGILTPHGHREVELKAVNVAGVAIQTQRVHENNLVAHVRGEGSRATARELDELTIPLDLPRNTPTVTAIDLQRVLPDQPGVYYVRAGATDRTWTADTAIICISDLGLTAKRERDGVTAWVTSLRTARPVPGAEVTAWSYNNQTLGAATTDADGIARLAVPDNHPDGEPWLITARLGDDLNYVVPERDRWVFDNMDHSGRPYPRTYDLLLYTERGVYRPGDPVHLTGLIRDDIGQVPPAFPMTLTVTRPDGRAVQEIAIASQPDQQGFFHGEYLSLPDGQLGAYRFSVTLPGAEEVLGETRALIEAFVPVRMEVTAVPTAPLFAPGQTPTVEANARYLFGQPAAGLPVTAGGTFRRVSFQSERFPDHTFADPHAGARMAAPQIEATLDEQGHATLELAPPEDAPPGLWEAAVAVTVSEPGGRSVSAGANLRVDTAGRHVGLRLPAGHLVPVDQDVAIGWTQVSHADEPAEPGALHYVLQRVEYESVLEQVSGRWVFKSVEDLTEVATGTVPAGPAAEGVLAVRCPTPGQYRLDVTDETSGSVTRLGFHAVRDAAAAVTVALDQPERAEVILDRDQYAPGSQARVLVRSPFPGTLWLTLETDRVLSTQVVDMTSNGIEVPLTVPETIRGGGFVTATIVRPLNPDEPQWLPHRAMGTARLTADHSAHKLPITIEAPAKARPGQSVQVIARISPPVDPQQPGHLHLWAVDEGILLTTAYETPDPLAWFLSPRTAGVWSADLFANLMPDYLRPADMTRIGGDGIAEESMRRSPVGVRHREPAVIWQTVVPLDADGTARADLKLPDLTGEMRIMGVAADHDCYGHAEHALTVTAPLLVESAWPRFAAPGDTFDVPVKLFNTSESPLTADVQISTPAGVLTVTEPQRPGVAVPPGGSSTIWFSATAGTLGAAEAQIQATATAVDGEALTATARADVAIRPAAPLVTVSQFLTVKPGDPVTLTPPETLRAETVRTAVSVGARPVVQLRPALQQLLDYPYGCLEQTTSRLFALLYAPDLFPMPDTPDRPEDITKALIQAGIFRLWSMQTRSGGFSYWPGDAHADAWASAYAGEFLLYASRRGFTVEPRFAGELCKYLESVLNDTGNDNIDANLRAMICHVLAGWDRPPRGWMTRLSEPNIQLDIAGRAHLAAAWLDAGRRDRAEQVLADDTLEQSIVATTGGRITSQVQQEAALLLVLLDLDTSHPWIVPLVQRLETARKDGHWGNTLETAGALAALARYQALSAEPADFRGTVSGPNVSMPFTDAEPFSLTWDRGQHPIQIASEGTGTIYVSVSYTGLAADDAVKPYDRQLTVRRKWLSGDGTPIDPAGVRAGDLIIVEVQLAAPNLDRHQTVDNVCIVDALPGGLEVENPRLVTSVRAEPSDEPSDVPDRVEFLDDRVLLFTSVGRDARTFRYSLRAVSAGSFVVPPIEASCMYDPGFASMHGAGKLVVGR